MVRLRFHGSLHRGPRSADLGWRLKTTTNNEQQEVSSPCSLLSFHDIHRRRQHNSLQFNLQNIHILLHLLSRQHLLWQRLQLRRSLLQQVVQQLCPRHQYSKGDAGHLRQTSPSMLLQRLQQAVQLHHHRRLHQAEQASRRLQKRLQDSGLLSALLRSSPTIWQIQIS